MKYAGQNEQKLKIPLKLLFLKVPINTSVMIITGFGGDSPMFKEAMELKPCAHAFKLFSKEELLEEVKNCLEGTN